MTAFQSMLRELSQARKASPSAFEGFRIRYSCLEKRLKVCFVNLAVGKSFLALDFSPDLFKLRFEAFPKIFYFTVRATRNVLSIVVPLMDTAICILMALHMALLEIDTIRLR